MRITLIRHGQTDWNTAGRAQGHTDICLNPVGYEQAEQVGMSFTGQTVDRILSSDLSRARLTAEAIGRATSVPVETLTELRERGFGQWEGDPYEDVHTRLDALAHECGIPAWEVQPPGGESYADVWNRTLPFVQRIRVLDGHTVVVSHGGTCAVMLAQFLAGTLTTSRSFRFTNTGQTELIRRHDGTFVLLRYNDTVHFGAM